MINLENITLVCITSIKIDRAIKALKYSYRGINFGEVLLFTDKEVSLPPDIKTINIAPLDLVGYSHFIVYELHKYINTDYVIIIQDDGFIVNPEKWDNKFLEYDYIGAPWALPHDNFSFRDPFGNIIRVGNGGFSLRSKKLLSLATELGLEWKPYFGYYNEDGFFTCHNKHIYENNGCIFATLDIAKYFSHENMIPEVDGIVPFGFHGKTHKYSNLI